MKTSLPEDIALYHAQAKVFQRSAGRSAVAAAAYRSASALTDDRIGQTFDYTKKPVVSAFIVAPEGAPAWAYDRQELWNRVEVSEYKKNAVVAREWEISIPRDIPQSEWESFAKDVAAPWVEAGAVVDIAIHRPPDVNGETQPHLHIMLSLRKLDTSTDSGFSKSKNADLIRQFESGGRHGGGSRADALKVERERIAVVMNSYLEKTDSPRRVSHLSNSARGIDREPEPSISEGRKIASKKRGKGDRRTAVVSSMRIAKACENELMKTEKELMNINLKHQFSDKNGIKPRHQQDYKATLLNRRFPDASSQIDAQKLYMVDTKNPAIARIQTRDGGWVEVENRQIKTYGTKGYADEIAQKLEKAGYADHIERLEESIRLGKKGSRKQHLPSAMPDAQAETIADKWRSRGYTDVQESPDGVYVRIGQSRIQDLGDEVRLHGKPTEAALRAMVAKSADEWGSEIEVTGSKSFKDALWLEAQRQGVKVFDSNGQPYAPSPEILTRWQADLAQMQSNQGEIDGIRKVKKITSLMKNAAAGDKPSLEELHKRDPHLSAFLRQHLDADQLKLLAQEKDSDLEPQLDGMRELGREILEEDQQQAQAQASKPDDAPTPNSAVEDELLSREDAEEFTEGEDPDAPKPRSPK
ncbi:MAG: MobA/MobL family protein [Alphaproteobacteria bacterium]|nr:MobA/MobL family protein [Alphaproteobacteria bacterium]MBU1549963.1 MobA/MobL family protein [Alphaproteobacteria bacterium]MBU2336581.1 MobA/MobL family protein [Alphaproteobacteria bacterium]MBU2387314.1 MobA/MobL family protein [Alphaproteobacteria bacterium]